MKMCWILAASCLVACKNDPPVVKEDAAPVSSRFTPLEEPDRGLPPVTMGPTGSSKTVYALLRGEQPSARFPLFATDDGGAVDDNMRDEIAPRFPGKIQVQQIEGAHEAEVKRVVNERMQRFFGCYQRGLQNNPNLSGMVRVALTLGENGNVTDVKQTGSELPDLRVIECVTERMRDLQLPKPEKAGDSLKIKLVFESLYEGLR